MPSSITLATLRDRVELLLQDSGNAIYSANDVDAAIRLALAKVNEKRPREVWDAVDAETREFDVSALSVLDPAAIVQVWFPYDSTDTNAEPEWVEFEVLDYNDTLYVRLIGGEEPAAGDIARVVFQRPHTLNGLDSASDTTFYQTMEAPLAKGAAAYALTARSGGNSEDETLAGTATPNQGTLGAMWMAEFEASLAVRAAGVSAHPSWT